MRMTNKIMQNNSLYNINNNKLLQDQLSTMMSTQKKITRPSDDPVIAIRALRLRTNVSELTQYYEKNAPDADSWITVTEKALGTVTDVLTDMIKQANKGANKDYGPENLQIIVEQLKSLRDEFYSTGNVDYAGRYVFTGYRTDTTMSFTEEVEAQPAGYPSYQITEQNKIADFDTINYTNIGKLDGLNKNNYTDAAYNGINEQDDVSNGDIHRMRLAYDVLSKGMTPTITYNADAGQKVSVSDTAKIMIDFGDGNGFQEVEIVGNRPDFGEIDLKGKEVTKIGDATTVAMLLPANTTVKKKDGTQETFSAARQAQVSVTVPAGTVVQGGAATGDVSDMQDGNVATVTGKKTVPDIKTVSTSDDPNPYQQMLKANQANKDLTIFIPETGEILFSNSVYSQIEKDVTTETEFQVTYKKNSWKDGDLRPEHYFACTGTTRDKDGNNKTVNYNQEYLTGDKKKQVIEYDVGYNQKIQVNTTADEVFTHNLDRDIDDLEKALSDLVTISATKEDLDMVLKGLEEGSAEYTDVKLKYEAADKAYSYIRENIHNMMESSITSFQNYLDDTNVAVTDNGTRSQRLDLISNRLMDQKTTFRTLQSENEDVDIAEVAVQLTSTELTYESALMATGKIMQTSLMNYI